MTISTEILNTWQEELDDLSPAEILQWASRKFGDRVQFSSSLGLEDQVITDMIAKVVPDMKIFTLDTGRLFTESYDLIKDVQDRYGQKILVYFPDRDEVEEMVREKGVNLFYERVEWRKLCCGIRKIHPLRRALSGLDAWITGLRKSQTVSRDQINKIQWDQGNGLVKINPLCDWSEKETLTYIKKYDVPYNVLHDRGYPSIGCACCTRAVKQGEDIRAGRWWWENEKHKECGLHIVDGKVVRQEAAPGT